MFSVTSVCDGENGSSQFVEDNQSIPVIQSHDVGRGSGIVQSHGIAFNSQDDQSLTKSVNTGIQESYVSLLADTTSVDKAQEFSNTQLDATLNDNNQYNVTTFSSKPELVGENLPRSLQNDSIIVQENQNTEYSLTSQTNSSSCFPQLVLLHNFTPAVINSTDENNTIFHIPNSVDPGMIADVASNQELEEAVANIDSYNDNDTDHTSDVLTNEQSYLVSTNNEGEIQNIQIVPGSVISTSTNVSFKEPKKEKSSKSVRKRTSLPLANTKPSESSTEVRKFSADELSNEGKTKQQLFEEYLGMTELDLMKKKTNNNDGKDVKMPEICDSVENVTDVIHVCIEKTPEPNELVNKSKDNVSEKSVSNTERGDNVIDHATVKPLDNSIENIPGQNDDRLQNNTLSNMAFVNAKSDVSQVHGNVCEGTTEKFTSLQSSIQYSKESDSKIGFKEVEKEKPKLMKVEGIQVTKQAKSCKRRGLKRKQQPDMRNVKVNKHFKRDSDTVTGDNGWRLLDDFCWILKTENKCILKLKPVTFKLMEPNEELTIELYVEDSINFNSVSQSVSTSGLLKHSIHFKKEDKNFGETISEYGRNVGLDNVVRNKQSSIDRKVRTKNVSTKRSKKLAQNKTKATDSNVPLSDPTSFEIPEENRKQFMDELEDSISVVTDNVCDSNKPDKGETNGTNVFIEGHQSDRPTTDCDMNVTDKIKPEILDDDDNDNIADDVDGDDNFTADKLSGKKSEPSEKINAKKDYIVKINELGRKIFECPTCGYFSKYPQNATKHIREHTATRDWTCEICGLGFKSNNGLQKHKIKHKPDRPFKCRLCPKMFKSKGVLKQHLQRHLELKQYVCEYCSKGFVTNGDLNKHQRSHTGDMPYQCDMCEKKYSDVSALYRHQREKHSNHLTCPQCSKKFPTQDKLLRHTRLSHPGRTAGLLNSDELYIPSLVPVNTLIETSQTESTVCSSLTML
ncbi:hypothetical protein ACF0H5_011945 [Mactra antiquata]